VFGPFEANIGIKQVFTLSIFISACCMALAFDQTDNISPYQI